uniref:Uncharacterized protein n=1 Tax=Timema shepardi TaxID=629360 RepID=A0A7R9AUW3_TIMSH|nr:unnamed protein product [Timema shepardi]
MLTEEGCCCCFRLLNVKEGERKISLYSIHSNPLNSNEFCVSGRDNFIRVYDRRNVSSVAKKFCPQHLVRTVYALFTLKGGSLTSMDYTMTLSRKPHHSGIMQEESNQRKFIDVSEEEVIVNMCISADVDEEEAMVDMCIAADVDEEEAMVDMCIAADVDEEEAMVDMIIAADVDEEEAMVDMCIAADVDEEEAMEDMCVAADLDKEEGEVASKII